MRKIAPSELIINNDNSVFHLHLRPGEAAPVVILVGDPARVRRVSAHFETLSVEVSNREFTTVTGTFRGKSVSVISTGIGAGNMDIVVNELDALFNVDFSTRTVKERKTSLILLRLGTCGAVQSDLRIGDLILSDLSVGFDGLLNYYAGRDNVCDLEIENAFVREAGWGKQLPAPYFVPCSRKLAALFADTTLRGMTVSAPGFYGPQGRRLRIEPVDLRLNEKLEKFSFAGRRFTNIEMEGAPLAGLAALLGHEAATICTVIAQRVARNAEIDYQQFVDKMIIMSLEKLSEM